MNSYTKLLINCVLVAAMVAAGIYVYLSLPHAMSQPMQWVDLNYNRPLALAIWFVYGIGIWSLFGLVIARLMLFLKPESVLLYGLASAVGFIVTMQSWNLLESYQPGAFFREVAYALVIPLLYAFLIRRRNRKQAGSA